ARHRVDVGARNAAGLGQRIAVEFAAGDQRRVGARLVLGETDLLQRARCFGAVFISSHMYSYYTPRTGLVKPPRRRIRRLPRRCAMPRRRMEPMGGEAPPGPPG